MKRNKGFTLVELLVVVGIIAVLVAISIPVFTSQLHKARVATDWANLRALYAELQTKSVIDDNWNYAKACKVTNDKKTITCGTNKVELEAGTIESYLDNNLTQTSSYEYFFYYMCDNKDAKHSLLISDNSIIPEIGNDFKPKTLN